MFLEWPFELLEEWFLLLWDHLEIKRLTFDSDLTLGRQKRWQVMNLVYKLESKEESPRMFNEIQQWSPIFVKN